MMKNLGMLNTVWVLIIPNCLSVFNMIIMRSFFFGIPESLREAAEIDGVGETMKMVTVMFATLPILLIYPWLQRYFVTGVTIGAVKG